jgi:hypothetical protein
LIFSEKILSLVFFKKKSFHWHQSIAIGSGGGFVPYFSAVARL